MASQFASISAAMDANALELAAMLEATDQAAKKALTDQGDAIVQQLVDITSQPGTSNNMGPVNPRSEPGMPAALQYGDYSGAWTATVEQNRDAGGRFSGGWTLSVGNSAPYAGLLEYGTSQMEARPALRPTFDEVTAALRKAIVDGIIEAQATLGAGWTGVELLLG
jgi:HK97 gp10 family phage protein